MDKQFFKWTHICLIQTDKDIRKTTAEFVKAVGKKYANTVIPVSEIYNCINT